MMELEPGGGVPIGPGDAVAAAEGVRRRRRARLFSSSLQAPASPTPATPMAATAPVWSSARRDNRCRNSRPFSVFRPRSSPPCYSLLRAFGAGAIKLSFCLLAGAPERVPRHHVHFLLGARGKQIAPERQSVAILRLCLEHPVDEVAGEGQIALGLQLAGPAEEGIGAGEPDNLGGLVSGRRREEVGRIAVVPAAVLPPDAVDDELRVSVDGPEVPFVDEIGRRLDFAQYLLQPLSLVHALDDLLGNGAEIARGVQSSGLHVLFADDRRAVAGQRMAG